jgi:hypothetical protein
MEKMVESWVFMKNGEDLEKYRNGSDGDIGGSGTAAVSGDGRWWVEVV